MSITPTYNLSILYVEDEEGIRNSVTRSLSIITEKVASVENGLEAIEFLKHNSVDLIITDIRMPKMDGISLIEKLREDKIDIPVIVASAFNETEYLLKAIDLKVDKFISKPIRMNDLFDVIAKLAESISNKKLLNIRQQELDRYKKAIEQAMYKIKIDITGKIIDSNQLIDDFFESKDSSKNYLDNIQNLIGEEESLELVSVSSNLKIYNKALVTTIDKKEFTIAVTAFASLIEDTDVKQISVLFNDISPIIREKNKIIEELYIDKLTGLANRMKLFNDLIEDEEKKVILFLDITNFSKINHLYGFEAGDKVLLQVKDILLNYWPGENLRKIYRNDADRFAILININKECTSDEVRSLANLIIEKIETHSFVLTDALQISIDVTMGGSYSGKDDLITEGLMALDVAKQENKNFVCFSDLKDLKNKINNNLAMQTKIKTALERDLFINYYQPIVDKDGKLVKYEALVRMIDPEDTSKILSPSSFLKIAQQSKNYALLTRRVIENAFRDFGNGWAVFSINLSFNDITNPLTVEYLENMISKHPKAQIHLELLEYEGLKDIEQTIRFCNIMKSHGAKISIDDFGSGYSNFTYFFDMPLDVLKIDGSLVKRIHEYRGYLALETIVQFANNLGIKTVAEYVEDESVFNKLKELGLDMYQGYYFAQPKPFDEL